MRYLSIYISNQPSTPITVIDLRHPNRRAVIDGIYYTDCHDAQGYLSNYKNIRKAFQKQKLKTRADTGEIKLSEFPLELEGAALLAKLESLQRRGKDQKRRCMHPNSLANLRPAAPFSKRNRPKKTSSITDEQLQQAIELRQSGCPWRVLGDKFGVNHDTLRLAVQKRGRKCQIGT